MQLVDALVCAEPGRLLIEQRPAPRPAPGEVLVRPLRVGICGTDYHIYEGKHPYLEYPRVMGHELAVEIVDAGESPDLKASEVCVVNPYLACGQCVACRNGKPNCCVRIAVLGVHRDGGMTGLLAVPAGNLIPAPGLTPDQCATVEFLAIGAHAVRRGAVAQRDRVLVVGAGPIGLGTALFARRAGASVVVHDRDADRLVSAGAIAGVPTVPPDADPIEAGATDGFDVVFDATGNARSMEKGFDYGAHGGRYVLVSVVKEPITFMDPDFHRKEMTLLGSRNATEQDFQSVITAIRDGAIPIDRLVTHRTSLAGAIRDISRWTTEKAGLIKAVVDLD